MSVKSTAIATAIASILCVADAGARDLSDIFTLRGYGTVGAVYSDEDQADFVAAAVSQPEGAGYSDSVSAAVDTKSALQINMTLTDRLSGVVQLISEGVHNNTWDDDPNKRFFPSLEWANLSYRVTDDITVRAGRVVLPFYLSSEYRKVGFTNHWIRPPVEVYGAHPFTSSDGADVAYSLKVGSATNTLRAHYGQLKLINHIFESDCDLWGVSDSVEIGSLILRAAYMNLKFTSVNGGLSPVFQGFAGAAGAIPGGEAAAQAALRLDGVYGSHGQAFDSYVLGLSYDPGKWFVMSEFAELMSDGILLDTTSGYVSGGYRLDKITPFATYARTKTHLRNESYIPLAGLPAPVAAMGGVINGIVSSFATGSTSQQTFSLGMRWDFRSSMALKAQYDYVDLAKNSHGMLTNQQPGFKNGSDVNVVSIALDYVF